MDDNGLGGRERRTRPEATVVMGDDRAIVGKLSPVIPDRGNCCRVVGGVMRDVGWA